MRNSTSIALIGISLLGIIGTTASALPSAPPAGGYTGGLFSRYFQNIVESAPNGGSCPVGQSLVGFTTTKNSTYGTPICSTITSPQYWSSTDSGANIYFTGAGNVAIGKAVGTAKLDVTGDILVNGVTVGRGGGNLTSNITLGNQAFNSNTVGGYNTAIGSESLRVNTTGNYNTAIGWDAIYNANADYNTAIGPMSLMNNVSGGMNTAIGVLSLGNTNGAQNVAIGHMAGQNLISGNNNIAIGFNTSFPSTTASNQLNIGNLIYGSGGNIGIGTTNPTSKLDLGTNFSNPGTFPNKITLWNGGANNYFGLGISSGDLDYISQGNHRFYVGYNGTPGTEAMAILSNGNMGLGIAAPSTKLAIAGQISGGFGAQTTAGTLDWNDVTNARSGNGNTLLLGTATNGPTVAGGMYYHPFSFEYSSKNGAGNMTQLAVPYNSSAMNAGMYMRSRYSGTWSNWTRILSENTAGNVGIGTTTPGAKLDVDGNIIVANTGGDYTYIRLGKDANDMIYADNTAAKSYGGGLWFRIQDALGTGYSDVLRLAENGNIGIGINPTAKLEVAGQVKINGGVPGAGKVLTSDATGLASWVTPSAGAISGGQTNYLARWLTATTLGTGSIFDNGTNVGIGTTSPTAKLHIAGPVRSTRLDDIGNIISKGDAGGWSMSHSFEGSAGTNRGGFGAYGGADALTYLWAGDSYTSPNMVWRGGNVGIGTTSPSSTLHVVGSSFLGGGNFELRDAGVADSTAVRLFSAGGNLYLQNGAGDNIVFRGKTGAATMNVSNAGVLNVVGGITDSAGTRMDAGGGWFRTYGAAGWYNGTYAGGIHMSDTTWIRTYGGKYFYVDSIIQAGAYMNSPAYYYISDARLKKDLRKIDSPLAKIEQMNGYYFNWKKDDKKDIGLIAQEVEKIFPDAVGEYTDPDSKEKYKNVEYGHLIAPVIEAIKELAANVRSNTTEIDALKSENAALKKRLDAIEAQLAK